MTFRGALLAYALAFGAMLMAGGVLVIATAGSLNSTNLLWVSAAFSVVAIVAAIVAALLPRR